MPSYTASFLPVGLALSLPGNGAARNHLGIMTSAAYDLLVNTSTIDFASTTGALLYGTAPTYVTGSVRCLWMGDVTRDGTVKYTGAGNDRDAILLALGGVSTATITGYHSSDTNMDGIVRYVGAGSDQSPILSDVLNGMPNSVRNEQLP